MKQILIIDDDLYIGNMLEEVLRKENYQVLRAYSGTEAILLLPSVKPDLILLDLMLPGLSGEELLPRIKDFPVIVLSAKVDVDSKVKLLLEGAVDYVTKPFETKELLARITVALRKNNSPVGNILSFADLHLDTETHMVFFSPKKDSGTRGHPQRPGGEPARLLFGVCRQGNLPRPFHHGTADHPPVEPPCSRQSFRKHPAERSEIRRWGSVCSTV